MIELIKNNFSKYKIHQLQLDPYGICNAKCWFCPVKYQGNPSVGKQIMSVELLEKIIKNIIEERDKPNGLVHKNFGGFYTAHYNEILLYPYFEELLKICVKYRLCFIILSNGIPLTPQKVDLILKYPGVVNGICLNIPAFDAETWSKRAGINAKQFELLLSNIRYAEKKLLYMVYNKSFSIQINGANEHSFSERGGWLDKGKDFPPDIDLDPSNGELKQQEQKARTLFPSIQIYPVPSLIDRAGLLNNVMTNKNAIHRNLQHGDESKRVVACGNGIEVGGRPFGWLHVNAVGDAFLCCNDYNFDYTFGNFKTQELKDFWGKDEHINKIEQSYNTICRSCASAKFEDNK